MRKIKIVIEAELELPDDYDIPSTGEDAGLGEEIEPSKFWASVSEGVSETFSKAVSGNYYVVHFEQIDPSIPRPRNRPGWPPGF